MKSVVLDFETYYDGPSGYTLSKMTTEEYVRDSRFEAILCGFKVNEAPAYWVEAADIPAELERLDIENCAVIAHHAHFDGLILSHHYGAKPKLWLDTLSMARAVHGAKGGNSLAKLAERYGIGAKGEEVMHAMGMRRRDFSPQALIAYGRYCVNDCELEYKLAQAMVPWFVDSEIKLIDRMVRMFTEPVLQLNTALLAKYRRDLQVQKMSLLMQAGVQMIDLSSNNRFAAALQFHGIEPPMKVSPTTGKLTYAFAKTDPAMQELAEHPDEAVQALVAARLGAKSTINETRAERLLDMAGRGSACVYLNYYGAGQTGRGSGGDKLNWQNFTRGSILRESVEAPDGYELVVGDSSNIESRMLDWLAGQEDQVEAYRLYDSGKGPDIYCVMAQKIYNRTITKKDNPDERQMGKTTKLGLGYGMGADKFVTAVRAQTKGKVKLTDEFAQNVVNIYRKSHSQVVKFWKRCDEALALIMAGKEGVKVDFRGVITTTKDGLLLPNGLIIKYPDLQWDKNDGYSYFNGRTREKIYGGKVCENIIQALARIIVMVQSLMVPRKLVLSVHDEGVWCVRAKSAPLVVEEVTQAFRTPMWWCPDLPLNCEVGHHKSYGKAKK